MSARSSSARTLGNRRLYACVGLPSRLHAAAWLGLIAIIQQVSCAGGGGVTNRRSDQVPGITLSVSPASAHISAGATAQFYVTVQNASNPAVTWQVNGIPGGNSFVGTITPSGATTVSYTAPASVSGAITVTVTAVLQADTTKFGSASVTITPSPNPVITVSPASANVVVGASLHFGASVQNGPQAVTWEVNGVPGGNAVLGKITWLPGSLTGFYTAPIQIPPSPMVTITAVLETNSLVSGKATVTIVSPPVSIGISPSTANLAAGQTLQFTPLVDNSKASVTWQVNGVAGGDPVHGTITSTGTYTAPANIPSPPTVTVTAMLQTSPPLSASAGVTIVQPGTFTGVYSWRNDNSLSGQNPQETLLTPSSVSSTTSPTFGKWFGCPVDGQIYAQPLYVANVTIPSQGTHNVVYVATEHDSVYAIDANSCQVFWQTSFIDPAAGVSTVPASDIPPEQDIVPEIGITGTPVIDPATATLYVVAKTKESGTYMQRLHALDLTTGAEKSGGPAAIQALVNGTGGGSSMGQISFDPLKENQRSALLLTGGKIYVAFDSYGDTIPFHGWLLAYDAADLTSAPAVFISTPNGSRGGVGQGGAAPSSDVTPSSSVNGNVFVVTSDGSFDSHNDYAETLLRLQVNTSVAPPALKIADTFTPSNESLLELTGPFGSTGVMLLPDSAGSATHPHLAVAGNQAGNLYLVDRDSLGGFSTSGVDNVLQTLCMGLPLTGTPAYAVNNNTPTIYLAAAGDSLKAFPLANGTFSSPSCPSLAIPNSHSNETFNTFGASPVISSNGSNTGIVWALDTSGYTTPAPAILRAYDASNLAKELFVSPSSGSGAAGPAVKFAVPTVANGKVYIGTQGELSVFGLH